jgi:aryl-alcohol dehydrogenase-like predicted oxidoreductase
MSGGNMAAKRKLGGSEIEVSPLMFGGNIFGWTIDEATSFQILDAYLDAGFDFIDTADVYSRWKPGNEGGESERIIGNWMQSRGVRSKVIVATKLGMEMGENKKGLSSRYIVEAVEASLTRLKTDYIDLYQSHRDDEETPLEETLEAYSKLIAAGKVRVIGASNYTGARLKQALEVSKANGWPRYESLQPHYNMADRAAYEADLEPVVLEEGVGVIPYFSLAAGFLTGKYRSEADLDKSPRGAGCRKYLNERGMRILAALDTVAEGLGATPAQVALAWLIARPSITAPIASATSLEQLKDLTASVNLTLGAEAIELLNTASQPE